MIPIEQPDLVTSGIRSMIMAFRRPGKRQPEKRKADSSTPPLTATNMSILHALTRANACRIFTTVTVD
jgi:hypothetical protein